MDYRQVLQSDTVLDRKYRIDRVIGAGGFGITYQAFDVGLASPVAIKEYYPAQFGMRDASLSVRPRTDGDRPLFDRLRASFLREARTLAQFDHPAIVRVLSVFESHGTAYMVMKYESGPSLKAWLQALGRVPTQNELDRLTWPLLDALQAMHRADFLHRDIAPDNIIVRADGSPVLLDFGASRRVVTQMSGTLTGVVKQGYSPQEQYSSDIRVQGAWTDIYALGATLYLAVTGRVPTEATARMLEDGMKPALEGAQKGFRTEFLTAIDAAMKLHPRDRPQTIAEWRDMLFFGAEEQFDYEGGDGYIGDQRSTPGERGPSSAPRAAARSQASSRPGSQPRSSTRQSSAPRPPLQSTSRPSVPSAAPPAAAAAPPDAATPSSEPISTRARQFAGSPRGAMVMGVGALLLGGGMLLAFDRVGGAARPPGNSSAAVEADREVKRLEAEYQRLATLEAARKAKEESDRKAREDTERLRLAALDAARKTKDDADRRVREQLERQQLASLEIARKVKEDADRKAREAEAERQRLAAAEAARQAKADADTKAREAEAERQRLAAAETARKAKEEADAKARQDAERQRLAALEAARQAKEAADAKAREDAERKVREEAERQRLAAAETARKAKEEADRKARDEAERQRLAAAEADAKARQEAERQRLAASAASAVTLTPSGATSPIRQADFAAGATASGLFPQSVAFAPGLILAGGSGGHIRLWDQASNQIRPLAATHADAVAAVALSTDGQHFASGAWDGEIRIWNTRTGALDHTIAGPRSSVAALAYRSETRLVAVHGNGSWSIIEPARGQLLMRSAATAERQVTAADISHDGRTLVVALADGATPYTIEGWVPANGGVTNTAGRLAGHQDWIYAVAISADGRHVASASADGTVRLWDWRTSRERLRLTGQAAHVRTLAFSANSALVAGAGEDGRVIVWRTETGEIAQRLDGASSTVRALAFSTDGTSLTAGSEDGQIRIWPAAATQP